MKNKLIILNREQIFIKKAFEYWIEHQLQYMPVKSLYLYPGIGHTTLWKILRKERSDLLLIPETLELGKHHEFIDNFSVRSEPSTYISKIEDKIIIIDCGGSSPDKYRKFINNALRYKAKGILVS